MGRNNEFFEHFERNKYLKKLPSMQRVKQHCEDLILKAFLTKLELSLKVLNTPPGIYLFGYRQGQ